MKTVLIVSPHFPPSTLAGVHRARHLAKYLHGQGWHPVIIRVDEAQYPETPDPDLAALVPDHVEQIRTGAIDISKTRRFGIGDIGIRGYSGLKAAVLAEVSKRDVDAILITGSPFYPMLMAGAVKRKTGLPIILDFQDPWIAAQGAERPYLSKGRMAHRLSMMLEPRAVKHADFITSVSETQNAQMAERYQHLHAGIMAAIPIGGDPEDFDALRQRPLSQVAFVLSDDHINLSFVGTFMPRTGPLMALLFQALQGLLDETPDLRNRLRLNFVGTSNQPNASDHKPVTDLANEFGLSDIVREHPQRVPFLEALNILANSDGLLLIGSDEPHYTASKIYPGLMSGTPYISLFHDASSANEILTSAQGGLVLSFNSERNLGDLVPEIADALKTLILKPETIPASNPSAYANVTANGVSRDFADVFDKAVARASKASS
ncbi:MAG: glycosyltransferase [Pseudomonadota bacterium]